jgi:hypothetical protein
MKERGILGAALAVALFAAFPPWADDWDGLGFLASVRRFDLASFAPHPPGYPVYVALLKVAAVACEPLAAARLVAVLSGLVAFLALSAALATTNPDAPRWESALGALAVIATPLALRAFSGVGTEGPALAFAAIAALGVVSVGARSRRFVVLAVGLGVGLGLGVRLSWAPFYLPFVFVLPRGLRVQGALVAVLACLAWGIPLACITGPSALVALASTHLTGHFERWGGTAATEPARIPFLVRDLFVDGFGGGGDVLGVVTMIGLAVATSSAMRVWWRRGAPRTELRRALLFAVPYLAWIAIGQNLREQPRHVLPLVTLGAYALVRAALEAPRRGRESAIFGVLAALWTLRAALDAQARRTIPPPGAQVVAFVRDHATAAPPESTAIFAGASGRFADGTEWQASVHAAGSLGDALVALARLDRLPRRVLVTSELVGADPASGLLEEVAVFCRPARLDRRLPCMHLYEVDMRTATSW